MCMDPLHCKPVNRIAVISDSRWPTCTEIIDSRRVLSRKCMTLAGLPFVHHLRVPATMATVIPCAMRNTNHGCWALAVPDVFR